MELGDEGKGPLNGAAAFSRTGTTGPFGPYTEVAKTLLDDVTNDKWLRLCNRAEKTGGELLREVVYLIVHGKTPAEFSSQATREVLAGKGLNAELIRDRTVA